MAARQRRACEATSSAVKALSRGTLTPSCLRSSGVSSLGLMGVAAIGQLLQRWRARLSASWRAGAGASQSPLPVLAVARHSDEPIRQLRRRGRWRRRLRVALGELLAADDGEVQPDL